MRTTCAAAAGRAYLLSVSPQWSVVVRTSAKPQWPPLFTPRPARIERVRCGFREGEEADLRDGRIRQLAPMYDIGSIEPLHGAVNGDDRSAIGTAAIPAQDEDVAFSEGSGSASCRYDGTDPNGECTCQAG